MPYKLCTFGSDTLIMKVNNKEHFTWIIKYINGCILSSIRGIFLKLHISRSVPMSYTARKFRHDRSITQGTLLAKRSTLSALSRL